MNNKRPWFADLHKSSGCGTFDLPLGTSLTKVQPTIGYLFCYYSVCVTNYMYMYIKSNNKIKSYISTFCNGLGEFEASRFNNKHI